MAKDRRLLLAATDAAVVVPPARRVMSPMSRLFATLMIDSSGSTVQSGGLAATVAALPGFRASVLANERLSRRLEWSVVTFSDDVTVLREFGPIAEWEVPSSIAGGRGTALGTAIQAGLRRHAAHVKRLAEKGIGLHHGFMLLVTDGYPTGEDSARYDEAVRMVRDAEKDRFAFFSIGMEGADFAKLGLLTPNRQPLQLASVGHFSQLMSWVLDSLVAVENSIVGEEVPLSNPLVASDPAKGWAKIPGGLPQEE